MSGVRRTTVGASLLAMASALTTVFSGGSLFDRKTNQCFYVVKKTLQCDLHAVNMSVRI
jgi:hypothetical protein